MILYRLRCDKGHEFESWFKDSKSYERQEKKSLIGCAVCGVAWVARAVMAPRLGKGCSKGEAEVEAPAAATSPPAPSPDQQQMAAMTRQMPKELREALLKVREQVEKNCEHVGDKFAEEARKIHYGESDKRGSSSQYKKAAHGRFLSFDGPVLQYAWHWLIPQINVLRGRSAACVSYARGVEETI